MKSHFFAYLSRMRFIQRWALMRNTAPENVQEHSHQVPSWPTPWRSSATKNSAALWTPARWPWRRSTMTPARS